MSKTRFVFKHAGFSGRGDARIRYYVYSAGGVPMFLGSVEGHGKSWTLDKGRDGTEFKSRMAAVQVLVGETP